MRCEVAAGLLILFVADLQYQCLADKQARKTLVRHNVRQRSLTLNKGGLDESQEDTPSRLRHL